MDGVLKMQSAYRSTRSLVQDNDYYYNDEPCSLEWYEKCKKEGLINENNK